MSAVGQQRSGYPVNRPTNPKSGPKANQPKVTGKGTVSTNYPTRNLPAGPKPAGRGGEGQNPRGFTGGSKSTPTTRRTKGARKIGG